MNHFKLEPEDSICQSLVADITHRCNMECANCYLPNRSIPDMNISKLYDLISRLPNRTYIRLLGGEPTLRADLAEIISTIIKMGHKPSLTTNGLKLAQLDYCQTLRDSGLKYVLISMNGANDDSLYKKLDNGKYATLKTRALENIIKCRFDFHIGMIIARNINETAISKLIHLIEDIALSNNVNFDNDLPYKRIKPIIRLKSIGTIGRHIKDASYSLHQLIDMTKSQLNLTSHFSTLQKVSSGVNYLDYAYNEGNYSYLMPLQTRSGTIYLRFIDWEADENGIPDAGNIRRGRITSDFKIAPFFEDIKLNEFGY